MLIWQATKILRDQNNTFSSFVTFLCNVLFVHHILYLMADYVMELTPSIKALGIMGFLISLFEVTGGCNHLLHRKDNIQT